MPGFKKGRPIIINQIFRAVPPPEEPSAGEHGSPELRAWWHEIMRELGKFKCYAMLLVLPADKEAVRYLAEYGRELDIISGADCLVITLTQTSIGIPGYPSHNEDPWPHSPEGHVQEGYSTRVADMFGVTLTEFPCLLLFRDIRSGEFALVPLKGMSLEQIITNMRAVFSSVQWAVASGHDPLASIKRFQSQQRLAGAGSKLTTFAGGLAGKTLEAALKALIELSFRPPGA